MEKLKIVYNGKGTTELYSSFLDGDSGWRGDNRLKDEAGRIAPRSCLGPNLAIFHNWVYMVFVADYGNDLWFAWHDGTKWSGDIKIADMNGGIDPKSNMCPQLVVFQNKLYMIYKAFDSPVLHMAWFDGTTWYGNKPIGNQANGFRLLSTETPAACVFQKRLWLVYKVSDKASFNSVWFDGSEWHEDKQILVDQSGQISPSLAVLGDKMYLVYRSLVKHMKLHSASFDGTKWKDNEKLWDNYPDEFCDEFPVAMVAYRNKIHIVFNDTIINESGQDYMNALISATFDGTAWQEPVPIKDQPGSIIRPSSQNRKGLGACVVPEQTKDRSDWMKNLDDYVLLSDLNLPGTHDSAAINSHVHTIYACQHLSISKQLKAGIRVLDIRIKTKKKGDGTFEFITCHGSIGSTIGANEYQTLISLLDECSVFLRSFPSEAIVMSLKIDDEANATSSTDKALARQALMKLLDDYPVMKDQNMPNLDSARGKIFLLNRITNDFSFGAPISWTDSTKGMLIESNSHRFFDVYVQDNYKDLPLIGSEEDKLSQVVNAFSQHRTGRLVLNFASAFWMGMGVYIMDHLLDFFGRRAVPDRPVYFGWTMFDYPTDRYQTNTYSFLSMVDIILASNIHYRGYTKTFKVN